MQPPSNFSKIRKEEINQEAFQLQSKAKKLGLKWNSDSISEAIRIYSKTLEMWKEIKDVSNTVICLRELAQLWLSIGDRKKSEQYLLSALKILPENELFDEKTKVFSQLSLLALETGQISKSYSFIIKAQNFAKKTNNPSAKAAAFSSAGEYYYYRDDLDNSRDFYQKALKQWQIANDSSGEAQTLLDLGYLFHLQGNYEQSLVYLNNALLKSKETFNLKNEALTLKALGTLFKVMGEYQESLESFKKAEKLFPQDLDLSERASLYNWVGSTFAEYMEWELSLNYRKKAFQLFERENHIYGQLATLPSLAKLSHLTQNDEIALSYLEQAENLAGKLNDQYYLATINEEKGNIFYERGNYQNAIVFYKKSLRLYEKDIYNKHIARVFNKFGQIYEKQNDLLLSRKYYLLALELNQKVKDRIGEAETLYNLAKLDSLEKNSETALEAVTNSIELTEYISSIVLSSKMTSSYFSNVYDRYELYINLLMKRHKQSANEEYKIQALQSAERSRARSILETMSLLETSFIKDSDPEIVKREKEIRVLLNVKADKLTDLLSQNADKAETEKISNEINEFEHELEEIKARLKQQSPIYSAIKNPAPFDVAEFQNTILDENTLLLEFAFGKEESYLWLVSKTEVNSYVLPPREQIEAKIQKLRELLASRQMIKGEEIEAYQARIVQAENEYWQTAKQLSDELFGQAADKLEKKRLIIVPDGKLNYFPVSALPLPNSETDEPILLSNEVVYEPSASTLSILAKSQNQASGATKNLLVFSDPVFTKEDSRISTKNGAESSNAETASAESFRFVESLNSLPRLTASKTEADSIVDILGRSSADNYSGFAANREQLLNANAADYKILHFATHGLIDEQRPELSGIVLSRFNETGQKLDEFVRLNDIYGMNLNSDLVVLSACETGIGKEVRGEGLQSLNNAFLQVGAKTVMSSLWKVEDNATLELMKNFYQALANERITPSKALQQAQIKMWQSGRYKSPFYWAAFTVQGNFRRAPRFSRDFPYEVVFSAAGLAAMVFGIFWVYGRKRGKLELLNRK